MIAAILETSARVNEFDRNRQTRPMATADWLLPGPNRGGADATTAGECGICSSQHNAETTEQVVAPIISAPLRRDYITLRSSENRLKLLQQWECIVSRVQNDCVECEMHDLTNADQPVEIAEIMLEEFNHFDRALLQEGAVFYWSVGHEISRTGQVRRYSEFRVRRMPRLSKLKKQEINEKAKHFSEFFTTLRK